MVPDAMTIRLHPRRIRLVEVVLVGGGPSPHNLATMWWEATQTLERPGDTHPLGGRRLGDAVSATSQPATDAAPSRRRASDRSVSAARSSGSTWAAHSFTEQRSSGRPAHFDDLLGGGRGGRSPPNSAASIGARPQLVDSDSVRREEDKGSEVPRM